MEINLYNLLLFDTKQNLGQSWNINLVGNLHFESNINLVYKRSSTGRKLIFVSSSKWRVDSTMYINFIQNRIIENL